MGSTQDRTFRFATDYRLLTKLHPLMGGVFIYKLVTLVIDQFATTSDFGHALSYGFLVDNCWHQL
ncbi:hypothetical protein [Halotia branconii]|uniref:Uncharacterized protein n=1 Tax=Halotia branconii CENA392 TaxID=1539056 RepID=A0AAJ6NUV3_9CYAN|nr:hypothetical protein [Halotia branconii]WGV26838.1 hypothetical protein QI031_04865 [Halotia branconii CENA392]